MVWGGWQGERSERGSTSDAHKARKSSICRELRAKDPRQDDQREVAGKQKSRRAWHAAARKDGGYVRARYDVLLASNLRRRGSQTARAKFFFLSPRCTCKPEKSYTQHNLTGAHTHTHQLPHPQPRRRALFAHAGMIAQRWWMTMETKMSDLGSPWRFLARTTDCDPRSPAPALGGLVVLALSHHPQAIVAPILRPASTGKARQKAEAD